MSGGNQYLDQIVMNLRNHRTGKLLPVYIDVFDNSLSRKWLNAINDLLERDLHLEKNYCFVGFNNSQRNLGYICNQINKTFEYINSADIGYTIDDYFSPDGAVTPGPVGSMQPGMRVNHDKFNQLHSYFEDLQGVSGAPSPYYTEAGPETRWHIRQLNLLCHEAESLILSMRKAIQAPEWRRPSQLMCWLHAPRFILDEEDYELFGVDTIARPTGAVYVGVNKAVGKHHWEVFNDEGADSRIDELVTSTLKSQTEAAGDFDIEWGKDNTGMSFIEEQLDEFRDWLVVNGFDPLDKSLTIGHPQVAQTDLIRSFGTDDSGEIWEILENYLDVFSVSTSSASAEYNYHWSDLDFSQRQIDIIGK
jgi:hypothetical protein